MPFGVFPVLHRGNRVEDILHSAVTNAFRRFPRSPRALGAQSLDTRTRHQCLSAFSPFSTGSIAESQLLEQLVTNAFRRFPRSPPARQFLKAKETNKCHQCLSAFSPFSTLAVGFRGRARRGLSPMPFGVFPVLHEFYNWLREMNLPKRHQCLSAFSPFSTHTFPSVGLQVALVSPMPFGVFPVLHSTFVTHCGARAQVFFRL